MLLLLLWLRILLLILVLEGLVEEDVVLLRKGLEGLTILLEVTKGRAKLLFLIPLTVLLLGGSATLRLA